MPLTSKNSCVPVRNLKEYFTQARTLRIPDWQREYSWKSTNSGQVGILLDDLKDFYESPDTEYLIGSLILCEDERNSSHKLLIDGQQRTLTFILFLMCARKFIRNKKLNIQDNEAHSEVVTGIRSCLSADKEEYLPKIYMNQENANEILELLYHWSSANDGVADEVFYDADTQTPTATNLVAAAKYIYTECFEKNRWVAKENFVEALGKILSSVRFVELELSSEDEAISVYDHINDRGLSLTSADLIKNRIFQSVDSSQFAEISLYWGDMSRTLNGCEVTRLKDPKFLLRALATAESDQKITYKKLTDFWGKHLKSPEVNPIDFALDLSLGAEFIKNYSDVFKHDTHGYLPELCFPYSLSSVQQYPLLLAVRNIEDRKVFKRVVKQIANRTAYYTLAGERTQEFESMVPKWAHALKKRGPRISMDEVNLIYCDPDIGAEISKEGFNRLRSTIKEWNYQSAGDRAKIRSLLAQLSWLTDKSVGKHPVESIDEYFRAKGRGEKQGWDIDHVLPTGKKSKDPILNGLGNLVLLFPTDNRSAQDAKPLMKKKMYEQNPLNLTKSLTSMDNVIEKDRSKILNLFAEAGVSDCTWSLETWDKDSIESRFELYFALIKYDLSTF